MEAWAKVLCSRRSLGRNSPAAKLALRDFFAINGALKSFAIESQARYEQDLINDLKTAPK